MRMPFPSRRTLILTGGVLLLGVGLLILRNSPLAPVPQVTTAEIEHQNLQPSLFGIGIVESRRSILVGPTTAGRVSRLHVEQGDTVLAGQVLAEMDPIDLQERLAASRHALARAQSSVAAAQAQGQEAESRFAMADTSAQRYRSLRERGFVSAEAERAKGHESRAAEAGLRSSQANITAARADSERLLSEVRALEKQLANTRLIAPVAGSIVSRDFEAGSTVVAGQAVLRMTESNSLWLRIRIDQGRSAGLAAGLSARIVLRSRPGESFSGKVVRIEQLSDAVTEERVAMVAFDSLPTGVTLNEMAEVTVHLPARPNVMVVPPAALARQEGRIGVFVVADGYARFRPLSIGIRTEHGIEVLSGLTAGDVLITHTPKPVADGERVRVKSVNGAST